MFVAPVPVRRARARFRVFRRPVVYYFPIQQFSPKLWMIQTKIYNHA